MATIDQYEIKREKIEARTPNRMEGYRVFDPPCSKVDALLPDMEPGLAWPGTSGPNAPIIYRARIEREWPGKPKIAKIVLYYRQPDWAGAFPPDDTQPIRGVLERRTSGHKERVLVDLDGKVIEGVVAPDSSVDPPTGERWKIAEGTNDILVPRTAFRISARAIDGYDVNQHESLVGSVNDNAIFSGYGPPGTILYLGADAAIKLRDNEKDYWHISLNFLKDRRGWNNLLKVNRFKKVVKLVEVLDVNGDPTGNTKPIIIEAKADEDEAPQARRTHPSANFGVFQDMLDL